MVASNQLTMSLAGSSNSSEGSRLTISLVLVRRYGLGGEEPETHAEIGARLGVGEERSRQLEREALRRLRSLGDGRRLAA